MSHRIQTFLFSFVAATVTGGSLCAGNLAYAQQPESAPRFTLVQQGSEQEFESNAQKRYVQARAAYDNLCSQYSLLYQKLVAARARNQEGQPNVNEVLAAQAEVQQVQQQLRQKSQEMDADAVIAGLMRRISVDFHNADLRVCTGLITKQCGLDIQVAREVSTDIRLTITAHETTVAALLEAIADDAHLMIAPSGQGILLTSWPFITINGQTTPSKEGNPPWSEEWGPATGSPYRGVQWKSLFNRPLDVMGTTQNPENAAFYGLKHIPAGGSEAFSKAAPAVPSGSLTAAPERLITGFASATLSPITMTAIGGNRVVIAEPYPASEGKQRILLTVYSWNGTHLNRVSSTVHTLSMPAVSPGKTTPRKP